MTAFCDFFSSSSLSTSNNSCNAFLESLSFTNSSTKLCVVKIGGFESTGLADTASLDNFLLFLAFFADDDADLKSFFVAEDDADVPKLPLVADPNPPDTFPRLKLWSKSPWLSMISFLKMQKLKSIFCYHK